MKPPIVELTTLARYWNSARIAAEARAPRHWSLTTNPPGCGVTCRVRMSATLDHRVPERLPPDPGDEAHENGDPEQLDAESGCERPGERFPDIDGDGEESHGLPGQ